MLTRHTTAAFFAGFAAFLLVADAAAFDFNQNVSIEAGSESDGESTVNGSITVGEDAVVSGGLETVNGTIRIGTNARVEDVETVNGSIHLAAGAGADNVSSVNGSISVDDGASASDVSIVNGRIEIRPGAEIEDDIENVNGQIEITGARVGGDLSTVNGDVSLAGEAVLAGDLTVEDAHGFNWRGSDGRKPKIVIGPGSRVEGEIMLEREVELYISESAEVGGVSGEMSLDQAVRFSGERP